MANKTNMDRVGEIAGQIGSHVRKAGSAVAEELKKFPVEETVETVGQVATETGRRVRKAAGRLGRELRKRLNR